MVFSLHYLDFEVFFDVEIFSSVEKGKKSFFLEREPFLYENIL